MKLQLYTSYILWCLSQHSKVLIHSAVSETRDIHIYLLCTRGVALYHQWLYAKLNQHWQIKVGPGMTVNDLILLEFEDPPSLKHWNLTSARHRPNLTSGRPHQKTWKESNWDPLLLLQQSRQHQVTRDLELWWPILASGGLMSGWRFQWNFRPAHVFYDHSGNLFFFCAKRSTIFQCFYMFIMFAFVDWCWL